MAAIHRPDNGPLYKEPFADSDTEATFRAPFLLPLSLFHSRSTAAKTRRNRGMPSTSTAPPPPPFPLPSSPLPSSRPPSCHLADYYAFLSFRFFDNSPPSRNSSFDRNIEEEKGEKGFYHLTKADRLRSKDSSSRSIDYL